MTLRDTHRQLHYGLQAAAGVGRALLPPKADDSHSSFTWSDAHGALVQDCVDGKYRAGLRLCDMTLLLIDANGAITDSHPLSGGTLDDGFGFYEERVGRMLARPGEGLPEHEVASGGVFMPVDEALATLAKMYGEAAAILERLRAQQPTASEVRCWPHHFDIALLIGLPYGRAIGVGFLGGDANIPEPYWYVYAWPTPENTLPPLRTGRWYAGAWVGGVLEGIHDRETVERFLDEAIKVLT